MEQCGSCGDQLGVDRFCTNCGRPVDAGDGWGTDTAERPAIREAGPGPVAAAPPPPPVLGPPPEVRYPLYADQAGPPPAAPPASTHGRARRNDAAWLPWAVGAAALLLVAALGAVLLLQPEKTDDTAADANRSRGSAPEQPAPAPTTAPTPAAPPIDVPESEPPVRKKPTDIASLASATTPATAAPNRDVDGNLVRYEPPNMLDGVPETTWRMPGDGSGTEVVFALDEVTRLTRVGLINGYAKIAGALDWYAGNRRVTSVEWVFDDGTIVPQPLGEVRELQTIGIDPVRTKAVTLRLISVSSPGRGPARRDYTAISDISLVGTPAQSS